jgi:glycosyltransferase involved in cell wall biosynthesis
MRLLIISHTPHYWREGKIVGWGATIREIDELATLFSSVTHLAPLSLEAAPVSAMAYQAPNVRLRAVPPAGGDRLRDKCGIALRYPGYARAILQERRRADVIHVRAPASISLLALLLLAILRQPHLRWAKYAGDWSGGEAERWSYRFQRWWLARGLHRGLVTVNGSWPGQPAHVCSFLNPCLTATELREGDEASRLKVLCQPVRLLFVGRLEVAKGVGVCLEVLAQLERAGIAAYLDLIGEGVERWQFERQAQALHVGASVNFHGGLPRTALGRFYSQAHFILLPSLCSEGWPKVLSEAMACGVVPLAHGISSIPQVFRNCSTGQAIPTLEPRRFTGTIESYLRTPLHWHEHSRNAVKAAQAFSYDNYLQAVRQLLKLPAPTQIAAT